MHMELVGMLSINMLKPAIMTVAVDTVGLMNRQHLERLWLNSVVKSGRHFLALIYP